MKKIIVAAAAMLLACATSFAQFNVNLGYANSKETTKVSSEKYSSSLNGFTVGFGYTLELLDNLFFTPGVNYLFVGGADANNVGGVLNLKGDVTEHYLNVPLTFSYDLELAPNTSFFVFAGPTASFGLASTTKVTASALGYQADTRIDNYDGDGYKRFDIMIGGGAGIKFADKYCFKVGYDYGLLNRIDSSNASEHRGQLTVGIAYLF